MSISSFICIPLKYSIDVIQKREYKYPQMYRETALAPPE